MQKLVDFLKEGTCAATVTRKLEEKFLAAGFQKLDLSEEWKLEVGGAYYVDVHKTSCLAFRVGEELSLIHISGHRPSDLSAAPVSV